jgi:hypothetical protein
MIINLVSLGIELSEDDYHLLIPHMRHHRDTLLSASDWTQMPDSPLTGAQREAWATYRQALRDFPATWTPGPEANFPELPA